MASSNGTRAAVDQAAIGSALASLQSGIGLPGAGTDAQADLAAALVRSSVQVNSAAMRELMFIRLYAGEQGLAFVEQLLRDKNHQNPGALKKFTEAIKALALFEHLRGFNLNLGGK